jgi:hypothetical protein
MSEFGSPTYPVARKEYRCEWCGEKIPRGQRHLKFTGMWEGDFQNWRMHLECDDARSQEDYSGDGFTPFENDRPEIEVLIACPS